jgi:tetratricopeptide (TPR) repeat protein
MALSSEGNNILRIAPLIEAARSAFLLEMTDLSLNYLDRLQKLLPDYAWIYYLYGRILFNKGEYNQALLSLQKSVECALKAPELLQQYVLPLIEHRNSCDGRRITNYMWKSFYNHNNEFQVSALMHLAFELKGDIYLLLEEKNKAIEAYCEAVGYLPLPDCIYKVNPILIQADKIEKLLEITQKGVMDSPFDSTLVLYEAYALIQLTKKREAAKILKEHQNALKSFVGIRKMLFIRKSINVILIFTFISQFLSSKIIIKILGILNR